MVRREQQEVPPEPASWGEAIQQYAKSKTTRPRPESEYQKPFYVTQYQKSREATEYHPILQTFRDAPREQFARTHETTSRVEQLNKARDKQIATECPFNILTFSDKRASLPQPPKVAAQAMLAPFNPHAERPTFRHPLDSCYQYNIVSNLPLTDHHFTAPALRPNVVEQKPNGGKPRLQHVAALPRDFNILSNRYVENHEPKVTLEREIQRRSAAQKYWETHEFEPVLQHYIQPEKEAAFQDFLAAETVKQPMKSFNRLPPSLQKGEGFVYDITSHEIKNAGLYQKELIKEAAQIERNAATWDRSESMRNQGLERQILADTRAINRQSHSRYQETFKHGFNIIDHRDFRDPETYIPPPRTRPQATLWQSVGPNRPPPPPPLQPPEPAIAPLQSTIPTSGPWAERTMAMRTGGSLAMSSTSPAKLSATAGSSPAMSATAPPVGGLMKLAAYEARAAAEAEPSPH